MGLGILLAGILPEVRPEVSKSSFFIRKLFEHTEYKGVGVTRAGIHGRINIRSLDFGPIASWDWCS